MRKNASSPLTLNEALHKATTLCSQAEHCCTDMREKLTRWGVKVDDADQIVNRLVHEKYIDEQRYARAFTHDRLLYSKWGRIKIQAQLRQLRISGVFIREALEAIPQEEYDGILRGVLQEKFHILGDNHDQDTRNKVIRFALQRGFDMEEIIGAIDSI